SGEPNVYRNNPHTIAELQNNITTEIRSITQQELMRVNSSFIRRCQGCLNAEGHHFSTSSVIKRSVLIIKIYVNFNYL
ncbi:hypothetical protein C0J52_15931, partial [Blattella germanica]